MKSDKQVFLRIWLKAGIPVLVLTAAVMALFLHMFLVAMEVLDIQRVELNGSQLALVLEGKDLTDQEELRKTLDLESFHMAAVLFDEYGREIARSDTDSYEGHRFPRSYYQNMLDTVCELQAGKQQEQRVIHVFGCNYEYGKKQLKAGGRNYVIHYAGVSAPWLLYAGGIVAAGMLVFAAVTALTVFIAWSCYRIYQKQKALEAAHCKAVNDLAHSLKTPMMIISGYSENFLEQVQMHKSRYYAQEIVENIKKMNGIVEQMLDFAKPGDEG